MPEGVFRASNAMRAFSFCLSQADAGEDCWLGLVDENAAALCVADGCGGSGSRRYEALGGCTGAYLASGLAVEVAAEWLAARPAVPLPGSGQAAQACADRLADRLRARFDRYAAETLREPASRLRGSLIRTLPTTLCALLAQTDGDSLRALALWAGDSRAYCLAPDGLRQLTRDDVSLPDAMASLRADPPLRGMVCSGAPFTLHGRALRLPAQCALLCVSDGAYAYLPTPMEFELLLLRTLEAAKSADDWKRRLGGALAPVIGDDATVLCAAYGYADFEAMRAGLSHRRAEMQRRYVTPVRRRKQSIPYATEVWREYRKHYEQSEEESHGDDLRRI